MKHFDKKYSFSGSNSVNFDGLTISGEELVRIANVVPEPDFAQELIPHLQRHGLVVSLVN